MAIESLRALMEAGENQDLCDIVIHSDCVDRGVTKEASFEKMRALYAAIRAPGPDMIRLCAPPAAWSAATARKCAPMCRAARRSAGITSGRSLHRRSKWAKATPV